MILALSVLSLALFGPGDIQDDSLQAMSDKIHHGEGTDGKVDLPRLVVMTPKAAGSDHRLVYLDVKIL